MNTGNKWHTSTGFQQRRLCDLGTTAPSTWLHKHKPHAMHSQKGLCPFLQHAVTKQWHMIQNTVQASWSVLFQCVNMKLVLLCSKCPAPPPKRGFQNAVKEIPPPQKKKNEKKKWWVGEKKKREREKKRGTKQKNRMAMSMNQVSFFGGLAARWRGRAGEHCAWHKH